MTTTPAWLAKLGWSIELEHVYDGPLADPVTYEALADTRVIVWRMRLRRGDELVRLAWMPAERLLQIDPNPGWSAHFVGRLKRFLISLGNEPALRG